MQTFVKRVVHFLKPQRLSLYPFVVGRTPKAQLFQHVVISAATLQMILMTASALWE